MPQVDITDCMLSMHSGAAGDRVHALVGQRRRHHRHVTARRDAAEPVGVGRGQFRDVVGDASVAMVPMASVQGFRVGFVHVACQHTGC